MTSSPPLLCRLGRHRLRGEPVWNRGFYFARVRGAAGATWSARRANAGTPRAARSWSGARLRRPAPAGPRWSHPRRPRARAATKTGCPTLPDMRARPCAPKGQPSRPTVPSPPSPRRLRHTSHWDGVRPFPTSWAWRDRGVERRQVQTGGREILYPPGTGKGITQRWRGLSRRTAARLLATAGRRWPWTFVPHPSTAPSRSSPGRLRASLAPPPPARPEQLCFTRWRMECWFWAWAMAASLWGLPASRRRWPVCASGVLFERRVASAAG